MVQSAKIFLVFFYYKRRTGVKFNIIPRDFNFWVLLIQHSGTGTKVGNVRLSEDEWVQIVQCPPPLWSSLFGAGEQTPHPLCSECTHTTSGLDNGWQTCQGVGGGWGRLDHRNTCITAQQLQFGFFFCLFMEMAPPCWCWGHEHTWAGFTYSCFCDEGFILS